LSAPVELATNALPLAIRDKSVIEETNGFDAVERRFNARFIELSIRLLVIGLLFYWTITIIQPFATIFVWSGVMAVAFYPLFNKFSALLGGRQIIAATLMTLGGLLLVIGPATWVAFGFIEPVKDLISGIESGNLPIPPPTESVKEWPLIGGQIYDFWELASTNLTSALSMIAPQLKPVGQYMLGMARNAGDGTLKFLLSVILTGFVIASGAQFLAMIRALARRINPSSGDKFVDLAGATINAVSRGVMGVSLGQAVVGGIGIGLAKVPAASLLTMAILVLGIIQIGPLLVVAPVIFWAWTHLNTGPAIALTLCMLTVNYMDNVLKPMLLAHGLSTPMLVIFIGVIGGVIAHGLPGLFVGPVVLAVIWDLGMAWIEEDPLDPDLPLVQPVQK
jgi:predicted PurR-regulated permease PerM